MATHSSTLGQKIPWTEEPGAGYCPWGRKELEMTERIHFTIKNKEIFHLQVTVNEMLVFIASKIFNQTPQLLG